MKLLYTDRGTLTEERYLELKDAGIAVESFGVANFHSGNIKEALVAEQNSGMEEGGASTRRAIDDEAIEASMNDFGDMDAGEDEFSPGEGSLNDLGVDDTADDIHGHEWFMDDDDGLVGSQEKEEEEFEGYSPGFLPSSLDDDDDDYFGKPGGSGWSAEDEKKWDADTLRGVDDLDEELQHSQAANIDMMSPVVKEAKARKITLKELKSLIRSVVKQQIR